MRDQFIPSTAVCSKCKTEKPATEFPKNPRKRNGLDSRCRACGRLATRLSYQKHREKHLAYAKEYREADRQKIRDAVARSRCRTQERLGIAAWLLDREQHMRTRFEQAGLVVEVVDYMAILKRDGWNCHICGGDIPVGDRSQLDFDHIIPYALGGTHTANNIAVAHRTCNRKKWKHLLDEYLEHT